MDLLHVFAVPKDDVASILKAPLVTGLTNFENRLFRSGKLR